MGWTKFPIVDELDEGWTMIRLWYIYRSADVLLGRKNGVDKKFDREANHVP